GVIETAGHVRSAVGARLPGLGARKLLVDNGVDERAREHRESTRLVSRNTQFGRSQTARVSYREQQGVTGVALFDGSGHSDVQTGSGSQQRGAGGAGELLCPYHPAEAGEASF